MRDAIRRENAIDLWQYHIEGGRHIRSLMRRIQVYVLIRLKKETRSGGMKMLDFTHYPNIFEDSATVTIVLGDIEQETMRLAEINKPVIVDVIFNDPATIIKWSDGVKTVVKAQSGDKYDPEKGFAMAIAKRWYGNKGSFNDVFKKWLPKETYQNKGSKIEVTVKPDVKEVEKQLESIKEKLGLSF